jgi:hypothetical protein
MTRTRLAVVALLATGGIAAGLLLSNGGNSNPAVAHVGGESITRDQLDATVDHFRKAAEAFARAAVNAFSRSRLLRAV